MSGKEDTRQSGTSSGESGGQGGSQTSKDKAADTDRAGTKTDIRSTDKQESGGQTEPPDNLRDGN